jgi:arginine decarboxylase
LVPSPRHILIEKDAKGKLKYREFSHEQRPKEVLEILGYYD